MISTENNGILYKKNLNSNVPSRGPGFLSTSPARTSSIASSIVNNCMIDDSALIDDFFFCPVILQL